MNQVIESLDSKNIEFSIDCELIKISRDSIVNKISELNPNLDEENCYEYLLFSLKEKFGKRFVYTIKNDDYLWLDTIGA
jgi:hypothetical protein